MRITDKQIEETGDIALQLRGYKLASEPMRAQAREFVQREIEALERSLAACETSQG